MGGLEDDEQGGRKGKRDNRSSWERKQTVSEQEGHKEIPH